MSVYITCAVKTFYLGVSEVMKAPLFLVGTFNRDYLNIYVIIISF